jgi:hypothetical protein
MTLADGRVVRQLSHDEVGEILAAFDNLSPGPGWPIWKVEHSQAVVFGAKRHVEFRQGEDGLQIINRTDANLGGTFVDPPRTRGRAAYGNRQWSLSAVEREVNHVIARCDDPEALRRPAPWDVDELLPFPTLQRFVVKTPEMARTLPTRFGARPGTRYVVGVLDEIRRGPHPSPVALDPGGDLGNWRDLAWFDRGTGAPIQVTTDPLELDAVLLESLASRAARWSSPPPAAPIPEVVVDRFLIRRVGRASGVIDADLDGVEGDLANRRPDYEEARCTEALSALAREVGPRSFARRTGLPIKDAERAALGHRLSEANCAKALRALHTASGRSCPIDGLQVPERPNAVYCSPACKDRAYWRRRKAAGLPKWPDTPPGGGEQAP